MINSNQIQKNQFIKLPINLEEFNNCSQDSNLLELNDNIDFNNSNIHQQQQQQQEQDVDRKKKITENRVKSLIQYRNKLQQMKQQKQENINNNVNSSAVTTNQTSSSSSSSSSNSAQQKNIFKGNIQKQLQEQKQQYNEMKQDARQQQSNEDINQKWTQSSRIVRLDGIDLVSQSISKKQYKINFLYIDDTLKKPKRKFVRFGDRTKKFYVDTHDINQKKIKITKARSNNLTPFDSRYWDVWILNSEKSINEAVMKYKIQHNLL